MYPGKDLLLTQLSYLAISVYQQENNEAHINYLIKQLSSSPGFPFNLAVTITALLLSFSCFSVVFAAAAAAFQC